MKAEELLKKNADRAFELLEQKTPRQLAVELVAAHDRTTRAERALDHAGFTYTNGAEEWKPPIGPSASPLLDQIDLLTFLLRELRDGVVGEWCFPGNLDERIDAALAGQVPSAEPLQSLLDWAVKSWHEQVAHRPMENVHRRTLDSVWRQVIRFSGEDPQSIIGPSHDDLLHSEQKPGGGE